MAMDQISRFAFPLHPSQYAPKPVPSLEEWQQLWEAWNLVTTEMIPRDALMEKPIPLRNPLLFYLGHIPTFEDIHLTRATGGKHTEPSNYADMFERGIDPDVDDPEICHDHSELPSVWPTVEEILCFRQSVCDRITALYADGRASSDRKIGRALWIGFEHEGLHLETFLYMLLQSDRVLPPPEARPDFAALADRAAKQRVENKWIRVPASRITHGFSDPENDEGPDRFFAWDNERPPYNVDVHSFDAQARPISNGEYAEYLSQTGGAIPITWVPRTSEPDNEQKSTLKLSSLFQNVSVKTVYGPVPLKHAVDWPLMASFDECDGYAKWAGCRIPTFDEVRSIYNLVEIQKAANKKDLHNKPLAFSPNPEDIFVDLTGCNTGLQHFHPLPVTQNGNRLSGLGDMGGAWEWTSTLLAPYEKFKPMDIYPGYTADFMDGKHNIVLGGSWATHPRITGRKSFINWWQLNYLYPWVAFRLVRDA